MVKRGDHPHVRLNSIKTADLLFGKSFLLDAFCSLVVSPTPLLWCLYTRSRLFLLLCDGRSHSYGTFGTWNGSNGLFFGLMTRRSGSNQTLHQTVRNLQKTSYRCSTSRVFTSRAFDKSAPEWITQQDSKKPPPVRTDGLSIGF